MSREESVERLSEIMRNVFDVDDLVRSSLSLDLYHFEKPLVPF
jgi:hypothetical protein